jgi:hypothetical protein
MFWHPMPSAGGFQQFTIHGRSILTHYLSQRTSKPVQSVTDIWTTYTVMSQRHVLYQAAMSVDTAHVTEHTCPWTIYRWGRSKSKRRNANYMQRTVSGADAGTCIFTQCTIVSKLWANTVGAADDGSQLACRQDRKKLNGRDLKQTEHAS